MAFDAKKTAAEVVQLVGGTENISSVAHCMTRLRFVVKDLNKADQEALKKDPRRAGRDLRRRPADGGFGQESAARV